MEPYLKESHPNPTVQNQDVNKAESVENFQKFIYDLFDKNGILNDLRAYLRGHIVDVLKSAQTGEPPSCQKHFKQRLDCTFQALNMLVAEYLLCLEFNYSLSVFVSEIPLANMVFGLAKSLMGLGADGEASKLRFGDTDVWSILNYLGVKCDSEHAKAIVDMYKAEEKSPLLLCILKCAQLCDMEPNDNVSQDSVSSSSKSSLDKRSTGSRCKHDAFCKACRGKYRRLKERYKRKKARYIEMFDQLKTVYESEIDMFKAEHEGKIKNSLASHAEHFQRMQKELEESYKAREEALKASIDDKKRFLWGLAQALRTQHAQMTRAMQAVKKQTAEIAQQEQNLKLQRTEAEESLKKRAEEMRQQIADELLILERHLDSYKIERESINRERNCETKVNSEVRNYLKKHYHLWKDELEVLKVYMENATNQPKSVIERGTATEDGFKGMNNEVERDRGMVREGRPNQVVNDLKKQKNVNFNQGKSEGESPGSHSSSSSEDVHLRRSERQPTTIRLASPQRAPVSLLEQSIRETECGWRKGAGEERTLLPSARILVPGDSIPFVGVVGRRSDSRRHLLNRWRMLRRRVSPLSAALVPPATSDSSAKTAVIRVHRTEVSNEPARDTDDPRQENTSTPTRDVIEPRTKVAETESPKMGERSPRSVLKEAKEKLKTVTRASASREKSPSAVLREAKRRLRKLEIEAEAVERSYMDYRRRRDKSPLLDDLTPCIPTTPSIMPTHHKEAPEHSKTQPHSTDSVHLDLEKYLKKYHINLDLGQDHFKNKNTATRLKNPVPEAYSEMDRNIKPIPKQDYLEKPITEFRKLYYTNPERACNISQDSMKSLRRSRENSPKTRKGKSSDIEDNTRKEIEMLKQSIIRNDLQEPINTAETSKEENMADNLLLVEVENVTEVKELNVEDQTDMVVLVESLVDCKEAIVAEPDDKADVSKMTLVVSPRHIEENNITIERLGTTLAGIRTAVRDNVITSSDFTLSVREEILTTKEYYAASGENYAPENIQTELRREPDSELQIPAQSSGIETFETVEIVEDYPDDFSDDVDNYKSDVNSPISLPKTSEDENFWD
ncbi:uncharacterized protein LOC125236155 isoform X2 [Leguminivora glycinivorella]|uniref:uncharacterized protein LOC125236155 isoform X2 n=1 Tax=Leguminivora glycinivorella TaxID=1035111 RepID=UPI00200C5D8B|nr:uncharacterized protein LOC125236155 isoform X2 [Leguminivora glycinivorella]